MQRYLHPSSQNEYVTCLGKGDLTNVTELRTVRWENYGFPSESDLITLGPEKQKTFPLQSEAKVTMEE